MHRSLHWLSVPDRISYKVSSLTLSSLYHIGPLYLSDKLQIYTPSRHLRSSLDDRQLRPPRFRTSTYGERSFSFQAPKTWSGLPVTLRHTDSLSSFKSGLKTHLFSKLYTCVVICVVVNAIGLLFVTLFFIYVGIHDA